LKIGWKKLDIEIIRSITWTNKFNYQEKIMVCYAWTIFNEIFLACLYVFIKTLWYTISFSYVYI
jgi:hypothetical protein